MATDHCQVATSANSINILDCNIFHVLIYIYIIYILETCRVTKFICKDSLKREVSYSISLLSIS